MLRYSKPRFDASCGPDPHIPTSRKRSKHPIRAPIKPKVRARKLKSDLVVRDTEIEDETHGQSTGEV